MNYRDTTDLMDARGHHAPLRSASVHEVCGIEEMTNEL
jgi:hypothetical protein